MDYLGWQDLVFFTFWMGLFVVLPAAVAALIVRRVRGLARDAGLIADAIERLPERVLSRAGGAGGD